MCGRYRLTAKERYLRDHFGLDEDLSWAPRWNIAPTQPVPIIRQHPKEPKRTFGLVRWGLIPYWAKDPSIGFKSINGYVGDCRGEARPPGRHETPLLDSRRRLL